MNKSRLIWGIICLVIAGVLAIVNLALPPENLMFQVGNQNMPWVPPVILGIVGIALLATARNKGEEMMTEKQTDVKAAPDAEKVAFNKRLETIAWGTFLVMLGGFMLVPDEVVSRGFWSIGIGVILLGLNAVRYYYGIKMSGFTTFIGILSLVGGIAQLAGWRSLEGAFFLIILGAYLILKPYFDRRQLFGKAEES